MDAVSILSATVGNKMFLASWLLALTAAMGMVGDKVFVERTVEIAVIEHKLDDIQSTLTRIDIRLEANGEKMDLLLVEQSILRAELKVQMTSAAKRKN
jgi:UPF0288 family protein (methanogenesis marker protein 3)